MYNMEQMKKAVKEQDETDKWVQQNFVKTLLDTENKGGLAKIIQSMLKPNGDGVALIKQMREVLKDIQSGKFASILGLILIIIFIFQS